MSPGFGEDIAPRTARLCVRISPESLGRLREAADLRSQDVTSFVLWTALDRAADILALERRTRPAPPTPDEPDPIVRDPDDPDDDLWDDYHVVREPLELRPLVFGALKARRHQERQRDREREQRELEDAFAREQALQARERDVERREQALLRLEGGLPEREEPPRDQTGAPRDREGAPQTR